MRTLFSVKNETGETWPAYGLARLGEVLSYDGVNSDVPLYELLKPDGEDGIYIVNGAAPLEDAQEGSGIHYLDAGYVAVEADEDAGVGDTIGAIDNQWTAGSGSGNGSQFKAVDVKNDSNISPVIAALATSPESEGGGGGGGGGSCSCICIDNGDIIVNGVETTSRWSVAMSAQTFKQTHGDIVFPAGTYIVVWNATTGKWELDIGDDLTARYLDGTSATSASTIDGTLTLEWSGLGTAPSLKLCVEGTIPPKSGS
jgi:hypothetical protein